MRTTKFCLFMCFIIVVNQLIAQLFYLKILGKKNDTLFLSLSAYLCDQRPWQEEVLHLKQLMTVDLSSSPLYIYIFFLTFYLGYEMFRTNYTHVNKFVTYSFRVQNTVQTYVILSLLDITCLPRFVSGCF